MTKHETYLLSRKALKFECGWKFMSSQENHGKPLNLIGKQWKTTPTIWHHPTKHTMTNGTSDDQLDWRAIWIQRYWFSILNIGVWASDLFFRVIKTEARVTQRAADWRLASKRAEQQQSMKRRNDERETTSQHMSPLVDSQSDQQGVGGRGVSP